MKKYEITLKSIIDVEFSDEEKAAEIYLGEDWQKTFFRISGLKELSGHIAFQFNRVNENWNIFKVKWTKYVEGVGVFEKNGADWICNEDIGLTITIRYVYEMFVDEIEEFIN